MTSAAGTLSASPAERPIYLAFTPNFSSVGMALRPSSGHRHGDCRTADKPKYNVNVRFPPIYIRCTSRS